MKAGLVPVRYNLCSLRRLLFKFTLSNASTLREGRQAQLGGHRRSNRSPPAQRPGANRVDLRALHAARVGTALDSRDDPKLVRVEYKGLVFDEPLHFDLLVDDCLLVEVIEVEIRHPSRKAQLFSYMKLLDIPIGLLINFHEPILRNGI